MLSDQQQITEGKASTELPGKQRALGRFSAIFVVAAALLGAVAFHTEPAKAWLWSGDVTLQGNSHCGLPATTWVWVQSPNGESGWATNGSGRYSFNFHRVPSGGMTVRINYGEPGVSCHDYVYV